MKVFFFPPTSPFNSYIDNIVSGIEHNGVTIVNKGKTNKFAKLLSSFTAMLEHTDVYHFNWIENKSSEDTIKNRMLCKAILLWFKLMRLAGGKLVWTMHNRESHFAKGNKTFHHQFMKKMIARMDMILVHAGETKDILIKEYGYPSNKICFVPHGNYIIANQSIPIIEEHSIFTLLAFGMVNRYKNIPLLIHAFNELGLEQAELKIYGKIDEKDAELGEQIKTELEQSNSVKYINEFVPDEKIDEIFRDADVAILPYDKKSMFNSGAAIMALSKGKPIIVSLFGAIKDIKNRDFVYAYDYATEEEHLDELKKAITKAYKVWREEKETLLVQGRHAYEYASHDLSWDKIGSDIVKKYEYICKK